jgi:threonine synthase
MEHVLALRCVVCGERYSPAEVDYSCPKHPDVGNLDVEYDYDVVRSNLDLEGQTRRDMWRYKAMMPIDSGAPVPPLSVGGTPLYQLDALAKELGVDGLWVKDDGRNPTASLKDRASAMLVAKAVYDKRDIITTASTGNAAAALAGLAASVGLPAVIFVPATAPEAKVTQLLVYGAHVMLVEGSYGDAYNLTLDVTKEYGWYCRNTGYNPYTAEGKKTVSYEICENLSGAPGKFEAPDAIFVSVGDGNIISGVHKGLRDLYALGLIDKVPRLMGVQAEGSAAMAKAWADGIDAVDMQPVAAQTVADSISADLPSDRVKAMNAVRETDGAYVTVSDDEILAAIPTLARTSGVFAEPAGAAAYAGLLKAVADRQVGASDRVVVLVTGNGLKDVASARKAVGEAYKVEPSLESVKPIADQLFAF